MEAYFHCSRKKYLIKHSETIDLDDTTTIELLKSCIENNKDSARGPTTRSALYARLAKLAACCFWMLMTSFSIVCQ